MQRKRAGGRNREPDGSLESTSRIHRERLRSEALHIRSYDHQWSYDLDVEIVTKNGKTVFQEHYYLLPGHTESEVGIVPSGHYELQVIIDNGDEVTFECDIDTTPEHTAVIEVGNGAIALSEGLER
ncbi:MAG: hypothetical protein ACLFNC_01405 [Halodesulfurarchaeum sp.]